MVSASTPLLRRGDTRRVDESFSGTLPGGLNGELALYSYEERSSGGSGGQAKEIHHFTIVVSDLPGMEGRLPGLFVQRRSGFRFLDGAEDVFRSTERITLESEALDRKCEIFADRRCDANWLRQLFDPSFVDFLAEGAPEGFAFEVENGTLCVNVNRYRGKASRAGRSLHRGDDGREADHRRGERVARARSAECSAPAGSRSGEPSGCSAGAC